MSFPFIEIASAALFLSRKKVFDKGRIIISGGKYVLFLQMLDGAKQKEIYVPRKNECQTNFFTVRLPKKEWPRRKKQG